MTGTARPTEPELFPIRPRPGKLTRRPTSARGEQDKTPRLESKPKCFSLRHVPTWSPWSPWGPGGSSRGFDSSQPSGSCLGPPGSFTFHGRPFGMKTTEIMLELHWVAHRVAKGVGAGGGRCQGVAVPHGEEEPCAGVRVTRTGVRHPPPHPPRGSCLF